MAMPAPLSLSSMAASMSEQAINQQKDYREEKLEALEKLAVEEIRSLEIPLPQNLSPFERFNFSVRVMLMKRHGMYEDRLEEFKSAIREKVQKGNPPSKPSAKKEQPRKSEADEAPMEKDKAEPNSEQATAESPTES